MRRFRILYYWLFFSKNNVNLKELVSFLFKPKVDVIAKRYIAETLQQGDFYEVSFNTIPNKLFWPSVFPIVGMNQVTAETFDRNDWHYYQKQHTEIKDGEILLDIGTAEGLFPLAVIDKCKHIYMVEPSSLFCGSLQKTFADYSDKITIFKTAIGNEDGEVFFEEGSLAGQISKEQSGNNKIQISKIDTLLAEGQKITYLKADIEGFEQEMLKGAARTIRENKPRIAITTYHPENDPNEIIALIKGYVPEYKHYVKGIHGEEPKPVMIHFWI
nr:FkbM family methyltransferase [uncultured Flavobacterium sp.]